MSDVFYLKKYEELTEGVKAVLESSDVLEQAITSSCSLETILDALEAVRRADLKLHFLVGWKIPPQPAFAVGERFELLHDASLVTIKEIHGESAFVVRDDGVHMHLSCGYLTVCKKVPHTCLPGLRGATIRRVPGGKLVAEFPALQAYSQTFATWVDAEKWLVEQAIRHDVVIEVINHETGAPLVALPNALPKPAPSDE